jgi:hypothetical protein
MLFYNKRTLPGGLFTVSVKKNCKNLLFSQINRAKCLLKPAVKYNVPSRSNYLTLSDVTPLKALMSWPVG